MRQVIGNLLANVRAHTGPGVPVALAVRPMGSNAVLTVADEGPGLSSEDAARAFDRFFRTEQDSTRSGSGLGLAIVQAAVLSHGGGTVELDTAPGRGVTAVVSLPLQGDSEKRSSGDRGAAGS
ncbi:sensor histidine kinase [Streptomyces sp. GMY02]|uniref:sensor histidine kinase n=1 Tax=Streptomyces sp. GMY02 TaxID=1333528 RepID=UPI001C2BAEC9|nr:sensor histidine kinase [Streptomyces sp. GMY02]QXE38411.1 sensor histidine kinase [Streptomyces sp. GMY02]